MCDIYKWATHLGTGLPMTSHWEDSSRIRRSYMLHVWRTAASDPFRLENWHSIVPHRLDNFLCFTCLKLNITFNGNSVVKLYDVFAVLPILCALGHFFAYFKCSGTTLNRMIHRYRYSLVNGLDPYLFKKQILIEVSFPGYRYKKISLYPFNKGTDPHEYRSKQILHA